MKKVLIGIVLVIILLFAVGSAVVVWQINPILEKLRPHIAKVISDAIKQEVVLGKLSVGLFPNASIEVSDVALLSPHSTQSAASLGKLALATDISSLLRGQVSVSELTISSPQARLTREADGSISLGSIKIYSPNAGKNESQTKPTAGAVAPAGGKDSSAEAPLKLAVKTVELKNLKVVLVDKTVTPNKELELKDFSAELTNIGGSEPAVLQGSGTILGAAQKNLSVSGTVDLSKKTGSLPPAQIEIALKSTDMGAISSLLEAYGAKPKELALSGDVSLKTRLVTDNAGIHLFPELDGTQTGVGWGTVFNKAKDIRLTVAAQVESPAEGAVNVSKCDVNLAGNEVHAPLSASPQEGIKVRVDTTKLALAELGKLLPPVRDYQLSGSMQAGVNIHLPKNTEQAPAYPNLQGSANLEGLAAQIPIGQAAQGTPKVIAVSSGSSKLRFEQQNIILQSFDASVFKGALHTEGSFTIPKDVSFSVAGKAFALEQVSTVFLSNSRFGLTGVLESLAARGSAQATDFASTLNASVQTRAGKGSITGINILGETLSKGSQIPGIAQLISSAIPQKYQPLLKANDTQFEQLLLAADVRGRIIDIKQLELTHPVYILSGQGTMAIGGKMELKAQLKLSPQLTQDLIAKEKNLKLLLDANGYLVIPVVITKDGEHALVLPDFSDLSKRAATNTVKDAAKKTLDRVAPGFGSALDSFFK
jgi:hypothetical protein